MSVKALEAAVRTRGVPSNAAWQVMMILAFHHNAKTGRCFPSYERMAEETGLNKSSVTRGVKELKEVGLIEVVKGRRAGTFNAPNSYKLVFMSHERLLASAERRKSADDVRTTRPDRETPTSSLRSEAGSTPKRKRAHKRAPKRRIDADWRPSKDLMAKAAQAGFEPQQIERMILDFRDYYTARGEISAAWGLDWSRWVRRQVDMKEQADVRNERTGPGGRGAERQQGFRSSHAAALEAVRGLGGGEGRLEGDPGRSEDDR